MAFKTKTDYFGIDDDAKIVCTSSSDGASHSVAEAKGEDGSVVAHEVYGATIAPSCEYALKSAWERGGEQPPNPIKLGSVTQTGDDKVALLNFSIGTSAGSAPTVSASGEKVAGDGCTYSIPAFTIPKTHHAHILFDAFTLGGSGCHLTEASYTASCGISKAEKEGVCLAHDVVEGKIEASINIVQTGSAEPTVEPGDGWYLSSPLACTNPDADYPTWEATLTKYLAKD